MSNKKINKLIEQATIDCYNIDECLSGFYTMIEDNLPFPFTATIVGEKAQIIGVEQTNQRIIAICVRNKKKYKIDILDVNIDHKSVIGVEWIEAYRVWLSQ